MISEPRTKLTEALDLLNEAAQEKKDELKGLLSDKYTHIKELMTSGVDQGKAAYTKARYFTKVAIEDAEGKIKEVTEDVNKKVHKDPWVFIAGAAVTAVVVGFFLGRTRGK